jgi:hypothetical protein
MNEKVFLIRPVTQSTIIVDEKDTPPVINGKSSIQVEGQEEPLALNERCNAYQYGNKVVVVFRPLDLKADPIEKVYCKED